MLFTSVKTLATGMRGARPVSGVGFGVSSKRTFMEVRETEAVSPTPETGVLPKLATKHWSLAFINSMFDDGSG